MCPRQAKSGAAGGPTDLSTTAGDLPGSHPDDNDIDPARPMTYPDQDAVTHAARLELLVDRHTRKKCLWNILDGVYPYLRDLIRQRTNSGSHEMRHGDDYVPDDAL